MSKIKAHSEFSPSSGHRWLNCAASVVYAKQLDGVIDTGGEAASRGTLMHTLASEALELAFKDDMSKVDSLNEDGYGNIKCYVDWILNKFKNADSVLIEKRLDLSKILYGCFGTADFIAWQQEEGIETLHVVDLKTGDIPVVVDNNTQLLIYALGAYLIKPTKSIWIHIVQGTEAKSWKVPDANVLKDLIAKMKEVPTKLTTMNHQFGSHCMYCVGAVKCPIIKQKLVGFVDGESGTDWNLDQLETILYLEKILGNLSDKIKSRLIFEHVENDYKPKRFDLKKRKGTMTWKDDAKERLERHPLRDKLFPPGILTPTKARAILSDSEIEEYVNEPKTTYSFYLKP